MTLDDAVILQDKWIANFTGKACQHNQLINPVMSDKGKDTGYQACMVCGVVFLELGKQLSPTEFKTLVRLSSEDISES